MNYSTIGRSSVAFAVIDFRLVSLECEARTRALVSAWWTPSDAASATEFCEDKANALSWLGVDALREN